MTARITLRAFAFAALALATISPARSADHLDAPVLKQPDQGGRDLNDVYVFQSPSNPANTVLVMTVNPFAGTVNPFGTVSPRKFDPSVEYQFQVDNNGDSVADVTYSTTFTAPVAGVQTLTTLRNGAGVASGGTGSNLLVAGGGMVRANLFEDPFFFDLVGFNNGLAFTGADTFAGKDISAIVLEVPSTSLQNGANTNIGVWARTLVGGNQIDRMGRPAINTALIPSDMKDAFNQGTPATDTANFADEAQASILTLNGGDAAHAAQTAAVLLPDLITFDTSNAGGFLNGRRLQDDVIDIALGVLSKAAVTSDGVNNNDAAFPGIFPYLANANFIPEPAALALCATAISAIALVACRRESRA